MQKDKFLSALKAQKQASDPKNSIWVFASAGSGKTKILTDRVLRLLLSGVAPGKILCLTFTKVAATEMQQRINSQLSQWLIASEEELKNDLEKLTDQQVSKAMIDEARSLLIKNLDDEFGLKIQTIHSFCQLLLSIFPFEAQIDSNFELLTDSQAMVALRSAQQKIIAKALLAQNSEINSPYFAGNNRPKEILANPDFLIFLENKDAINSSLLNFCNVDLRQGPKDQSENQPENQPENQLLLASIKKIAAEISDQSLLEIIFKLLGKKDKLLFLLEKFGSLSKIIQQIADLFGIKIAAEKLANNPEFNLQYGDFEAEIFENFLVNFDRKKWQKIAEILANSKQAKAQKIGKNLVKFCQQVNFKNFTDIKGSIVKYEENGAVRLQKKLGKDIEQFEQDFVSLVDYFVEVDQRVSSAKILTQNADLLRLVFAIIEEYQKFKQENGYLDYSDLILLTTKLLNNHQYREFIRLKMDGLFEHILVDESQDTNFEQWEIISALAEEFFVEDNSSEKTQNRPERSLFVVGDEKQSIYGFQGAQVKIASEVLHKLQKLYPQKIKEISLNISFRSKSKILEAVDLVFADDFRKKAIAHSGNYLPHQAFRGEGGYVELWQPIATRSENQEFEEDEEGPINFGDSEFSAKNFSWEFPKIIKNQQNQGQNRFFEQQKTDQQILANLIAKKISTWIKHKKSVKNREIQFGDIMILVSNKTNGLAQNLFAEFANFDIPTSSINKVKASKSLVIQDFLSLARFVLLPEDDFNLACLLKSPFFNVGEDELAKFCQERNSQKNNEKNGEKNWQKTTLFEVLKPKEIGRKLLKMQNLAAQKSCFEFYYQMLFDDLHQASFLSRMGKKTKSLAESFIFLVAEFCKKSKSELQLLVDYIEQSDPEFDASFGDENAVKIATIHSAKGLQAPIVIIPDCLHDLKRSPANIENIIWLENLPLWITADAKPNFLIKELKERRFLGIYEEYLRLFYVAMTRAEEELYIGGFGKKIGKDCWYEIAKESLVNSSGDFAKEVNLQEDLRDFEEENQFLGKDKIAKKDGFSEIFSNNFEQDISKNFLKDDPKKASKFLQFAATDFGKILHQGLELLIKFAKNLPIKNSDFAPDFTNEFFTNFCKNFAKSQNLQDFQRQELENLLNAFFRSEIFTEIFRENLSVESEIELACGEESGRIDLLVEKPKEIWIIDFKSDEKRPQNLSEIYRNQLGKYQKLAQNSFPNKKIRTALLWLRFMELQWIEF